MVFWAVVKTTKTFKIISKILSFIAIFTVVTLTVLLVGTRLIGYTPYTVLSGSMEPHYHVGSVVYVTDVNLEDLKEKDCITYRISGGTIVTHRIIEVIEDNGELFFRTKGDANKTPDGILPASSVIGKTVFSIPYLGYLADFVQRPIGLIVIVGGCLAVFIISYGIDWLASSINENQSQKNEADASDDN